jgi:alkylation response protein AidB-like acyl-CoA dehydrogenase
MAALDSLGAFALTEPDHGSDSVALETSARREGEDWVIDGRKKWIGNGTIADVVIVWARDVADRQVKGFLVEKGTAGYHARRIDGKGSLRAGAQTPGVAATGGYRIRRNWLPRNPERPRSTTDPGTPAPKALVSKACYSFIVTP